MASPSWGPFCSHRLHFPLKQPSREMTHASLGAPFLATANPGINLITRSSLRGWGSEAPRRITSCPRLLGRIILPGSQAPGGLPPLPQKARLAATLPCRRTAALTHGRPGVWLLGSGQGSEPGLGSRMWQERRPLQDIGRQPRIFFTSPGMGRLGCPWALGGAPRAELGEFRWAVLRHPSVSVVSPGGPALRQCRNLIFSPLL